MSCEQCNTVILAYLYGIWNILCFVLRTNNRWSSYDFCFRIRQADSPTHTFPLRTKRRQKWNTSLRDKWAQGQAHRYFLALVCTACASQIGGLQGTAFIFSLATTLFCVVSVAFNKTTKKCNFRYQFRTSCSVQLHLRISEKRRG